MVVSFGSLLGRVGNGFRLGCRLTSWVAISSALGSWLRVEVGAWLSYRVGFTSGRASALPLLSVAVALRVVLGSPSEMDFALGGQHGSPSGCPLGHGFGCARFSVSGQLRVELVPLSASGLPLVELRYRVRSPWVSVRPLGQWSASVGSWLASG